jgi:hypothetical protein
MVRHVEKQNLCDGDRQGPLEADSLARQTLVEETRQGRANRAEPAQRNGCNGADEGAVAGVELCEAARCRLVSETLSSV